MTLERFENIAHKELFNFPDIGSEMGEIERVAEHYFATSKSVFISKFLETASRTKLCELLEEVWSVLENTDSFDIAEGEWGKIDEHIKHTNTETGASRDWQGIREKIERNESIDAPIILKYNNVFHLVSGNTRLMIMRALGKRPRVLIVEMRDPDHAK